MTLVFLPLKHASSSNSQPCSLQQPSWTLAAEDEGSSAERARCNEKRKVLEAGLRELRGIQEYQPVRFEGTWSQSISYFTNFLLNSSLEITKPPNQAPESPKETTPDIDTVRHNTFPSVSNVGIEYPVRRDADLAPVEESRPEDAQNSRKPPPHTVFNRVAHGLA